jgi:hypothetical protein
MGAAHSMGGGSGAVNTQNNAITSAQNKYQQRLDSRSIERKLPK